MLSEEQNQNFNDYDRYGVYKENYLNLKENSPEESHVEFRNEEHISLGRSIQQFLKNLDSDVIGHESQKFQDYIANKSSLMEGEYDPHRDIDDGEYSLETEEDKKLYEVLGFEKMENENLRYIEDNLWDTERETPRRLEEEED